MHSIFRYITGIAICCMLLLSSGYLFAQGSGLRIVIIRHGEKPPKGHDLSCQGQNRAMALPDVIVKKFGKPVQIYVPSMGGGKKTTRSRMFQTAMPLAKRYNIEVNSNYDEKDYQGLASHLLSRKGTILVVWEHDAISHIAKALGVTGAGKWSGSDYDSIWIIDSPGNKAVLTRDKENLHPAADCR